MFHPVFFFLREMFPLDFIYTKKTIGNTKEMMSVDAGPGDPWAWGCGSYHFQPHVYTRLDPPVLIPLQMREVNQCIDCVARVRHRRGPL